MLKLIIFSNFTAGGIGSELVRRFVDLGSTVVCVDYNQKELNRLKDEIGSSNVFADSKDKNNNNKRVHYYVLDITSIDQIKEVSERIRREVGNVSILINNAGTVNQAKLLLDLTEQEISRLFQVFKPIYLYLCVYIHSHESNNQLTFFSFCLIIIKTSSRSRSLSNIVV